MAIDDLIPDLAPVESNGKPTRKRRPPATARTVRNESDPLDVRTQEGRTDLANSRRFVRLHGERVRHCHAWGKWVVWDSTRWALDTDGAVVRLAKSVADSVWAEARECGDTDALKFAARTASDKSIRAFLNLAASDVAVHPEDLDCNGWLLNCPNGTLDLRTGELRAHRREDMLTKITTASYNADAGSFAWDRFLEDVFTVQPLIDFMRRLLGYALTGDTREHVLPVFWGRGANGKSTLLESYMHALGPDYSGKATADLLLAKRSDGHPTAIADLHGKRFLACVETGDGRRLNEALVKELTGGDTLKARRMYEDFWQFAPTHKLALCSNHKPTVRGTDLGIWRRLRLIPFVESFTGTRADKTLPDKLKAEADGILAWAVRGCLEWQRGGLTEPDEVQAATAEYRSAEDTIARFLDECCAVTPDAETRGPDLYRRFREWCERGGEHPFSARRFASALEEKGFARRISNGVVWERIALNG